jgi:hypothetical protein
LECGGLTPLWPVTIGKRNFSETKAGRPKRRQAAALQGVDASAIQSFYAEIHNSGRKLTSESGAYCKQPDRGKKRLRQQQCSLTCNQKRLVCQLVETDCNENQY